MSNAINNHIDIALSESAIPKIGSATKALGVSQDVFNVNECRVLSWIPCAIPWIVEDNQNVSFGDAMRKAPLVGITGFSLLPLPFNESEALELLENDGDAIGSGICGGVASLLELERVGRNTLVGEVPIEEVPDMGELQAEVRALLGKVCLMLTLRRGGIGVVGLEDVRSGMKEGDTSFDRRVTAVAFSL
ncbi:UNVERIFIED_CONTAM: hypothetical protein HDU68_011532 [Siphonaria sp. JEL0065]|nr:hypothetical protein HDU68_011532 [Siphonaria sp. JEL0065]